MIKNTQKSTVLFAAFVMLGACETSPKEETEFLQAVRGKTVNIGGTDMYKFSSDGRSIDDLRATGIPMTLSKVNSSTEAVYVLQEPGETSPEAFATMKLNDDRKSGSFVLTAAANGAVLQQGQAILK